MSINFNINGTLKPTGDYATHSEDYNRGGYRVVNDIAGLGSLRSDYIKTGMLVYQKDIKTLLQYTDGAFEIADFKLARYQTSAIVSNGFSIGFQSTGLVQLTTTSDLITIDGGSTGQMVTIQADGTSTVTIKTTGNISLQGNADITLATDEDTATFVFNGSKWCLISSQIT